jgi:hypothetical protein
LCSGQVVSAVEHCFRVVLERMGGFLYSRNLTLYTHSTAFTTHVQCTDAERHEPDRISTFYRGASLITCG